MGGTSLLLNQQDSPRAPDRYASPSGGSLFTFDTNDIQSTNRGDDTTTGRGTPNGIGFLITELRYLFRL